MAGRRTLALAAVALMVALAVVRTAVVVGNYTLAKEEMRRQYEKHAEESVENTKAYVKSWTGWALNRIRVGLGFKPTPLSDPVHPINYEEDDNHRPGKAEDIKSMATGKAAGEAATNKAEEAKAKAKQGYDTAKKLTQETLDAAKEKYDAAGGCKDEL